MALTFQGFVEEASLPSEYFVEYWSDRLLGPCMLSLRHPGTGGDGASC